MLSRIFVTPALVAATAIWAAQPASPQPDSQPSDSSVHTEITSDLVVTVQQVGGKIEEFKDEIVRFELILDGGGRLDQIHLITRSNAEADTHIWYNVDNLVSVRYQFLAITGKGKISVRTTSAPQIKAPVQAVPRPVVPLDPEDYR